MHQFRSHNRNGSALQVLLNAIENSTFNVHNKWELYRFGIKCAIGTQPTCVDDKLIAHYKDIIKEQNKTKPTPTAKEKAINKRFANQRITNKKQRRRVTQNNNKQTKPKRYKKHAQKRNENKKFVSMIIILCIHLIG